MANFEHLRFPIKIRGDYDSRQGGPVRRKVNPKTEKNLKNRSEHGKRLTEKLNIVRKEWFSTFLNRSTEGLPTLPNAIPFFLQIDSDDFDPDSLKVFGIEVISEEDGGFIIGTSSDIDLKRLKEKIDDFVKEKGKSKNTAAKLWEIIEGKQWRIDQILSKSLQDKWEAIEEGTEYLVNIGVACYIKIPDYPSRGNDSEEVYQERIKNWEARRAELNEARDDLMMARENDIMNFVSGYKGEIKSAFIDLTDSFSCQISISGKGLKDLVFNFPFLFEVEEVELLEEPIIGGHTEPKDFGPNLIPPHQKAPKVCVIDSGIQEGHRLLEPAILKENSSCYLPGESDIADLVSDGGHGTRVASALLFPDGVPRSGDYELPLWLQNAKVLNEKCLLTDSIYPPQLMKDIVERFHTGGTRIFNMSINASVPCRLVHISSWAAMLDKLTWENDLLFVISAGNIYLEDVHENNPGIERFINSNLEYPQYLFENFCRIANPAQSAQAIVVGSICKEKYEDEDTASFGKFGEPSAFTRIGPGIWGMIKPDVVEFGGDFIRNKQGSPNLRVLEKTCPEMARSTYRGGPAVARDKVGTSFAAPRVAHILAKIQETIPEASTLLYRALLVQSAEWPKSLSDDGHEPYSILRWMGYGIPDLKKATGNSEHRITLVGEDVIGPLQAHIYTVKIPEYLRRPGDRFPIKLEITISYKAIPRRTRRRTKSYLSNWVHWESSKMGESFLLFQNRILKDLNLDDVLEEDTNSFPWVIKRKKGGGVKEISLTESTLQKDWCVVESNQLPTELCIAVVGHKGWEKDLKAEVPYAVVVSIEAMSKEIEVYELIRVENEIEIQV